MRIMTEYFEKTKKYTATTILLLPAIGTSRRSLVKYGFLNGYLDDKSHDVHYVEAVYMLFRPESWDKFTVHLEREQANTDNFIASYDYAGGYIVLVYSILDQWKADYKLFLEGKYSHFSKEYKDTFPKLVNTIDKDTGIPITKPSLQAHIFQKSDAMKKFWELDLGIKFSELGEDMEVWAAPNMVKETLDIDAIRLTLTV
jgi:hypothetical protein